MQPCRSRILHSSALLQIALSIRIINIIVFINQKGGVVNASPSLKYYLPPGRWSAALPPQREPSLAVCQEWSQLPALAALIAKVDNNKVVIKVFIKTPIF